MNDAFNVHVRLAGRSEYEPPVLMDLGGRLPADGNVDVPISGRLVRAHITNVATPERQERGAVGVVHQVYADEVS